MRVVLFLGLLATGCTAGRSPESADPAREHAAPASAVGTRTGVRPRPRRYPVSPRRGPAKRPLRPLGASWDRPMARELPASPRARIGIPASLW